MCAGVHACKTSSHTIHQVAILLYRSSAVLKPKMAKVPELEELREFLLTSFAAYSWAPGLSCRAA